MQKNNITKTLLYVCIVFIIIICDVITKIWIINHFNLYEKKKIFYFLNFLYIKNYGSALGLISNYEEWQSYLLSIVNLCIIIKIIKLIHTAILNKTYKNNILYCLILGGAISNVLNRIYFGYIIDFIDIDIKKLHCPTFNIADTSIFLGICILILRSIK
ncbi:Lipoprotein signal peptidase [Buchnera aphidicola (Thelaxes suberi)]|uniref:signal peptidase II n=1 Tax=Buchnera aphidicola TaxID=9 RepID=UPI0034649617